MLVLLATGFLTACGYHVKQSKEPATVSIPFVKGDHEGQLVAELARQLSSSGHYTYVKEGGEHLLQIVIVDDHANRIGFRYDQGEFSGKIKKNLMADENRRQIEADVTLFRADTDQPVFGPVRVSASSDFDYVYVNSLDTLSFINATGQREKVMTFSLGQLDSVEGAQDDALFAIYRALSAKIVESMASFQEN